MWAIREQSIHSFVTEYVTMAASLGTIAQPAVLKVNAG